MSITDLGDEGRVLFCNWWNWRPTLAIIERLIDVDPRELERMRFSGGGGRLSEVEASALALGLRAKVLPAVPEGGRLLLDGSATLVPDDGTLDRVDLERNYSASRGWLEEFAAFCEQCSGFEVL